MKPSPLMQQLIEQLAAKHALDLIAPGQYLRLAIPDNPIHLIIETTDDRQVIVGCYDDHGTEDADPYLRFAPDYPLGWLPMELLYSPQAWTDFLQQTGATVHPDDVDLADLTEYWAGRLIAQGWLRNGEVQTAPHWRLPGCQSANHTRCYGDLWQCAACQKWICCAEGTDNHPELCDDCWAARFAPADEGDTPEITFTPEGTLALPCACPEACGAWLELTADGILALEDKEGLRVSLLLPDWLDDAIRQAAAMQHAAQPKISQEPLND